MWTYNDIYRVVIFYINQDLRDTDYTLNFGVVGIATQTPRVIVKFCLKNVQTNSQRQWRMIIVGETTRELESSVQALVEDQLNRVRRDL